MLRSAVGAWVLVLVVVGLVVGSSVLGPGTAGTAERAAPPIPPAVGSCVRGYVDTRVVPCNQEHLGEVVFAWTGETPGPGVVLPGPDEWFDPDDTLSYCWPAVADFIGDEQVPARTDGIEWWWPVPGNTAVTVLGPDPQPVEGWSWTACVLVPEGGRTTSSLRAVADPRVPRPDNWRHCGVVIPVWNEPVPCTTPHRFELVASGNITSLTPEQLGSVTAAADRGEAGSEFVDLGGLVIDHPAAAADCRALAEIHLGGSLADRETELRAVVGALSFIQVIEDGDFRNEGLSVTCVLEILGDRPVVGSVAGIGSGPLPYG